MLKSIIVAALLVALTGCSLFGIRSGTEQRSYTLVETLESGVEIRRYPAAVFAEAIVSTDVEEPRNAAFRMLFRYITGTNDGAEEIAMTAPVSVVGETDGEEIAMTAPVRSELREGAMAMRFYHPESYTLDTAPRPTEEGVVLGLEDEQLVAVLTYTWSTDEARAAEMRAELLARLERTRWQAAGVSYSLFYDPPWTLPFLRRNEAVVSLISQAN